MKCLFLVKLAAAALIAGPALAATITNDRLAGEAYELDPTQFASLSTFFKPGGSVTTSLGVRADGRHAILKNLADAVPDGITRIRTGRASRGSTAPTSDCCVGM